MAGEKKKGGEPREEREAASGIERQQRTQRLLSFLHMGRRGKYYPGQ